jgi:hypothetical protein
MAGAMMCGSFLEMRRIVNATVSGWLWRANVDDRSRRNEKREQEFTDTNEGPR